MNLGSYRHRRWPLVFLLVLLSLEILFVYSSTERKRRPITDAAATSDQAQHTPHSSLRHQRREAAKEDEPQRRPRIVGGVNVSASLRIVDGTEASSADYPYFILWGGCGATLIHNDIALSAAHCTREKDAQIGPQNRYDSSNTRTRVVQVLSHPQYDPESYDYDFAILKLNGWFQSKTVRLNYNEGRPYVGESLQILGFGGQSLTLKEGKVEAISSTSCARQWEGAGYEIDESAVLCAISDAGVNPCTGDSGGPLLSSNIQVGVISSGSDCDGILPAVYSRVSVAKDWIKSQICELSDFPPLDCLGPINRRPFPTVTVRVDIHLDDYPHDIIWRITTNEGDERTTEIASGGDFELPNSLESRFVYLQSGTHYDFTIEDVSGHADGLGSNGRYTVWTVNNEGNSENILVSGGSNFQQSESSTFAIGNVLKPTLPPSAAPAPRQVLSFPTLSPVAPTKSPTRSPTPKPTREPTPKPTRKPTPKPTREPTTRKPTLMLSIAASAIPTDRPTDKPVSSSKPTSKLTNESTLEPTRKPITRKPTKRPTIQPAVLPTKDPTMNPTDPPTKSQTKEPTSRPTKQPATSSPTRVPTDEPTSKPTKTRKPTRTPTLEPISSPKEDPSVNPIINRTREPSDVVRAPDDYDYDDAFLSRSLQYTNQPAASERLSSAPSSDPLSLQSASEPTVLPTDHPSVLFSPIISFMPSESQMPSHSPTTSPMLTTTTPSTAGLPVVDFSESITTTAIASTNTPSISPSIGNPMDISVDTSSASPTTKSSSDNPTDVPSGNPIDNPSDNPTDVGSDSPTYNPSASSSADLPSASPTAKSSSDNPTDVASDSPTDNPSASSPVDLPSASPSASPTAKIPSDNPTDVALDNPTDNPSTSPTTKSSPDNPTDVASDNPTDNPSTSPTTSFSDTPTDTASDSPTDNSSASPTTKSLADVVSDSPTEITSASPTLESPTAVLSDSPTVIPSSPSANPTDAPTFPVHRYMTYMAYVNVTIFENPEEVSWRIIDALSQEQFYGYPAGNYKDATTFTNFLNMHTGIWEFELTRESLAADAKVEVGYLNLLTGGTVYLGKISFGSDIAATTVSTLMLLT